MNTSDFLASLDAVKRTGPNRWLARCPAHDDKSPSLSIREADDGRTLITCFAGCDAGAVASSVGMTLSDLFPRDNPTAIRGVRSPVPASDVLEALEVEALTVALIAADIAKGGAVDHPRKARLLEAAGRIAAAIENAKETRYDSRYR